MPYAKLRHERRVRNPTYSAYRIGDSVVALVLGSKPFPAGCTLSLSRHQPLSALNFSFSIFWTPPVNLRSFNAFRHLSEKQERLLLATTRQTQVESGSLLLEHQQLSQEAYIVTEGSVALNRQTPLGELRLATLVPGSIFGEMSFIEAKPRSLSVVAEEDSTLLLLDRRAINATIADNPLFEVSLYWAFWRSLSEKLRATNELLLRFFETSPKQPPTFTPLPTSQMMHLDLARRRETLRVLSLSNMEVNFFASLAEAKKLEPNQQLFRAGDKAETMFLVVSGRVMISLHIPGAGEEALTFLNPGDVFGEMGLIDSAPRCADAGATDEGAVVLAIRNEVLSKVLHPEKASSIRLLKALCTTLSNRVRDTNEKLVGWYLLSGGKIPRLKA